LKNIYNRTPVRTAIGEYPSESNYDVTIVSDFSIRYHYIHQPDTLYEMFEASSRGGKVHFG